MTRSRVLITVACLTAAVLSPLATTLGASQAHALDNGVAKTPPLGWNSWNSFGCNPSETLVRQMADAMVNSGMRDAGYQYVVIDDCWFNPNRDSAGNIQPNTSRFPNGMKAVGDYLHSKGLKFGIYEGPLTKTCAQYFNSYPGATGSKGHEYADAKQFASWGVDYLKYDWCDPSGSIDDQVRTFNVMRDALAATGRPIVYSINSNSVHSKTGPQRNWGDVANMWRTTEDIQDMWMSNQTNGYPMGVQNIVNVTVPLAAYAKPGQWNDMDMLEVGRGGMTDTEQRSHFALWAIMNSPLIAGNDLRTMSTTTRDILTNRDLLAINQDPLGMQARQISFDGTRRVLAKPMADGSWAVALFNQGTSTTTISTNAAAIGATGGPFTLKDAWTKAVTTTTGDISASVPGHGTVVYRVTRASTPTPTTTTPSPTTSSPDPTTSSPTTSGPTLPKKSFSLVNAAGSACLDAPNSATTDGTQPIVWTCHSAANQAWVLKKKTLQVLGVCLDVPADATDGTAARLMRCTGSAWQKWQLRKDGTVYSPKAKLCLDAGAGASNTPVTLRTCTKDAAQRWSRD
ncbi:MAG: alpha-galactosidase [Kineosporiaceae bacterium]